MITFSYVIFSIFVNFLFFIIHIFVWRLMDNSSPRLGLLTTIFLICYLISVIIFNYFFKVIFHDHIWLTLPTSICMYIIYVHFYVGMLKSVSFRIMSEIIVRKEMQISLNDLRKIYSFNGMVEPRLELLVKKKWLDRENEKYVCTKLSKYVALSNMIFHKLFRLNITG